MRRLIITTIIMLLVAIGANADSYHKAPTTLTDSLERILERRDTYYTMHKWQIDSVKRVLAQTPKDDASRRMLLLHDIFERYKSFQGDSAMAIADREIALAGSTASRENEVMARRDKLFALVSRANYTQAVDLVRTTDLSHVSPQIRGMFYFVCIRLFSDMSNFHDGTFTDENARISKLYADSVIATMPPHSYEACYASVFKTIDELTTTQKIEVLKELLQRGNTSNDDKATIASIIADNYLRLGDKENCYLYKARSAIYDITSAKRETSSLRSLAELAFQEGKFELASRFINAALEDANYFNAPQRKSEIANVLPLIESQRYLNVDGRRRALQIALYVCAALFLGMVVAIIFYVRATRRLSQSNALLAKRTQELQNANKELEMANHVSVQTNAKLQETLLKMRESVKIKDEYIGYSFYTNSEYIKRIETLYHKVDRKLKLRQYEDLQMSLRESDIGKERKKILKDFDSVFLRIFPTFVERYNALFDPAETSGESKTHKADSGEGLTSEMRIFALIRLGVNDIAKIAQFLDYSVNTVNTYKTRAKNRSRVPNDQFEEAIMAIRSVD